MNNINKTTYENFVEEIKDRIYESQYRALKSVNTELISLYWGIGESIIENQEQHGWGKSVVENLSDDLQKEFPGVKGFSTQNLWYMRQFYLEYKDSQKLQPLVGEISWSKHIVIIGKCKDDLEREFYIKMTKKYGWSKSVLIHQIEGKSYAQFLLNQTNFDKSLTKENKYQAKLAVKDSYSFDFLEMMENYKERDLELGLIKNIRSFLMEMGGEYSFIGNQYKLSLDGEDFYIDLLLYHRKLKSLVAIELKTTDFKPEYAGKMQFYLSVLDDKVKMEDENPSIGIIVCKSKNRLVVEYALNTATKPMGVADYSLSTSVPKELKGLLPSPEQIAESLDKMLD